MVDILKVRAKAKEKKSSKAAAKKKKGKKSKETEPHDSAVEPVEVQSESQGGGVAKPLEEDEVIVSVQTEEAVASAPVETSAIEDADEEVVAAVEMPETRGRSSRLQHFIETAGVADADLETIGDETEEEVAGDELLTFVVRGEYFAIEVANLVEIVVPRPATVVPNSPTEINGLISLRGAIVTLIDIRHLLSLDRGVTETLDSRIIVLRDGDDLLGFHVDAVSRVAVVRQEEIEPHPAISNTELSSLIKGVFTQGDKLVSLLDLRRVGETNVA